MLSVSIILYMNLERPFAVENWGGNTILVPKYD